MKRKRKPRKIKLRGAVYRHERRRRRGSGIVVAVMAVLVAAAAYVHWQQVTIPQTKSAAKTVATTAAKGDSPAATPSAGPQPGDLLSVESVERFSTLQTQELARENYGTATLPIDTGIEKITFTYRMELPTGEFIPVTARAYLPQSPVSNLPIFDFAPGTTGIGNECAASLEDVARANWGNYDSHMAMYASQGFAAVTTDYEGMLDPPRIHHYMVGELEGRAVLDAARALEQLPEAQGRLDANSVFLAGYSQGGQAAYWADKIAPTYAPSIKPLGVIGWGPVMSVTQAVESVYYGSTLDWFTPYVLYSYSSYYNQSVASFGPVLLPHWQATLDRDVPAHCIDTDIEFWGTNPEKVYTSQFEQAVKSGTLSEVYPQLYDDMEQNEVGSDPSSSAKIIFSGLEDNVVLSSQEISEAKVLCSTSKGPVDLDLMPNTTHYDAMVKSLRTVLSWMHTLVEGGRVSDTCNTGSS